MIAQKIDKEASLRGLSRTQFIIFLAHQIMPKYKKHAFTIRATRYQKRKKDSKWKLVHITPDEMNYCFMVEMRCLYTFSMSALIARAFDEYLNSQNLISKKLQKAGCHDNYCYNGRIIINTKSNMHIFRKSYWNIPPNP